MPESTGRETAVSRRRPGVAGHCRPSRYCGSCVGERRTTPSCTRPTPTGVACGGDSWQPGLARSLRPFQGCRPEQHRSIPESRRPTVPVFGTVGLPSQSHSRTHTVPRQHRPHPQPRRPRHPRNVQRLSYFRIDNCSDDPSHHYRWNGGIGDYIRALLRILLCCLTGDTCHQDSPNAKKQAKAYSILQRVPALYPQDIRIAQSPCLSPARNRQRIGRQIRNGTANRSPCSARYVDILAHECPFRPHQFSQRAGCLLGLRFHRQGNKHPTEQRHKPW